MVVQLNPFVSSMKVISFSTVQPMVTPPMIWGEWSHLLASPKQGWKLTRRAPTFCQMAQLQSCNQMSMSLEPLKFHSHIFYLLHQQSPCSNLLPSLFMNRTVFAKEADALLAIRPILIEPPPELRCPLCKNIFKDAVMIPCCQYSFCDKCKSLFFKPNSLAAPSFWSCGWTLTLFTVGKFSGRYKGGVNCQG
jgi:hypothetical protein